MSFYYIGNSNQDPSLGMKPIEWAYFGDPRPFQTKNYPAKKTKINKTAEKELAKFYRMYFPGFVYVRE
jgi:hypothetical protein